eukprot:2047452-Pleurochrysis_carterae.AAC.1
MCVGARLQVDLQVSVCARALFSSWSPTHLQARVPASVYRHVRVCARACVCLRVFMCQVLVELVQGVKKGDGVAFDGGRRGLHDEVRACRGGGWRRLRRMSGESERHRG